MGALFVASAAHAAGPAQTQPDAAAPAGHRITFRCDQLTAQQAAGSLVCSGHVLVRDGNLLLCCDRLVATAPGPFPPAGAQKLRCTGDVRAAQTGGELAWAEWAEYRPEPGQLTLGGAPALTRAQTVLRGRRLVWQLIGPTAGEVTVQAPSGSLLAQQHGALWPDDGKGSLPPDGVAAPPPSWLQDPLPAACPLPPRPATGPKPAQDSRP